MGKAISDDSDNDGHNSSSKQDNVDWILKVLHNDGIERLDLWGWELVCTEYLLSKLLGMLVILETRILIREKTSNESRDASELLNYQLGRCNCIGALDGVPVVIRKYLTQVFFGESEIPITVVNEWLIS